MTSLSVLHRALEGRTPGALRPWWDRLREPMDLVVVGGGVHGAGIARDAALRGLKVAVVDAGDWAGGTSSRSSKLFHGGLRYLAMGQVGLVRESLRERELHLKLMPGLVRPLRFRVVLPGRPLRTRLKFRLGVALYHALSGGAARAHLWRGEPSYQDAVTDDARFVWELIRDARARGAVALNYCTWRRWVREPRGGIGAAEMEDGITGATVQVRARAWVNAAGPWAGQVEPSGALRLTRGTHVILRGCAGDGEARLFLSPSDNRVLFVIPYLGGCSLVGTTDLDEAAPLREPVPLEEEIRYLHGAFARVFPQWRGWAPVGWQCGLRPLVSEGGRPSEVSREERVMRGSGPLWSVLGGKYTGYRAVAERVMDAVTGAPAPVGKRTREIPLTPDPPGGDPLEAAFRAEDAVLPEDALYRRTFWGYAAPAGKDPVREAVDGFSRRWDLDSEHAEEAAAAVREGLRARQRVLDLWS